MKKSAFSIKEFTLILFGLGLLSVTLLNSSFSEKALASANSTNVNSSSDLSNLDLGTPIYVEKYSVPKNGSEQFIGNGTLFGLDVVVAEGNATFVSRDNNTVFIHGTAQLALNDGNQTDVAPYTFEAIGYYYEDGSFENNGVAIFDNISVGKLSGLNNMVGVFKGKSDPSGNGIFLMWKLK